MSNSLISSLTALLDHATISSMASRIGESEEPVSRALRPTFAAILGGMAARANDPGVQRYIFDIAGALPSASLETAKLLNLASSGAAASPLFEISRRVLPVILGENRSSIAEQIEQTSGLSAGGAERVMAVATPIVLGFLGRRIREESLNIDQFTGLLQREMFEIDSNVSGSAQHSEDPQRRAGNNSPWLLPVIAGLAMLAAVFWFAERSSGAGNEGSRVRAADAGNRARPAIAGSGDFVGRELPGGIHLSIPEKGVEARLLAAIQGPAPVNGSAWLDCDRLTFDTNSALLRPESEEQLQNIAAILKAYPNVRLKVGGYTADEGNSRVRMRLSQHRADTVTRELASMGIAASRMESEGYGAQAAIAVNMTEDGRARNRRISLQLLQK